MTADALFAVLWDALVDVLGSAATAALVRRAIKRAALRRSGVAQLAVEREGFEYGFVVPESWSRDDADALADLHALARELSPLLVELTGPVVVQRLNRIAELATCGLHFGEEQIP